MKNYTDTEIFERYSKLLVAHTYRLLGDKDEVSDVVKDEGICCFSGTKLCIKFEIPNEKNKKIAVSLEI